LRALPRVFLTFHTIPALTPSAVPTKISRSRLNLVERAFPGPAGPRDWSQNIARDSMVAGPAARPPQQLRHPRALQDAALAFSPRLREATLWHKYFGSINGLARGSGGP
jgi:hypothetical protein